MAYDANGNTTQKGSQQFSYNFRNQLVRSIDGGSTIMLKYDPLGRRIEKIGSGNTIKFYYVGNQVIEERKGSDQVLKQYVYGNGIDELLRMDLYSGSTSTPYYVHTNDIGSTTAIIDGNGALVERVGYDTFGLPLFTDAAGQSIGASSIGNSILFQGREYDIDLNLYNYRARYYDPIMGRFLQTDPIGYQDSMNLYQGMNMNAANYIDPNGTWNFQTHENITTNAATLEQRFIEQRFPNSMFMLFYPQLRSGSSLPDFGYDPWGLVINPGELFHGMYTEQYPDQDKYIEAIKNTAIVNLIKARDIFDSGVEMNKGEFLNLQAQFIMIKGLTLCGEVLHMIQDNYAPAHVERDDQLNIIRYQVYTEQNPAMHIVNDLGYGNEKEFNAAVSATQNIIRLFFGDKTDFVEGLKILLNEFLKTKPDIKSNENINRT
jgi:RHS repeat-associated protein